MNGLLVNGQVPVGPPAGVGWGWAPLRPEFNPSPMRTDATLSFTTSLAGDLRVEFFDLRGRRVRVLLDRTLAPAGFHRLAFDGRDDGRSPLPTGVYFYRVQAQEGTNGGRFLIVR